MSQDDDQRFMAEAIALSLTHLGWTSTNPSVGCIIVKDGEVVGRAVTAAGGRPHAEVQALAEAGEAARGATVYVTLEPCSHHGKTPPCADALVAAGVARVVVAVGDPDPRVNGRGLSILRDAGIVVETGLMEAEARRALAAYLMRQTAHRAQVILKLAVSADGMIGRRGEGQLPVTGPEARAFVQQLRAHSDAILVGVGTVCADDPELTVRLPGLEQHSPLRIVLDRRLEIPLTSKLVRTARTVPVVVVADSGNGDDGARRHALEQAGVEILEDGHLDSFLFALATRGISTVIVEGGAKVAASFLAAGLVDRILLFTGQTHLGADAIAAPVTRDNIPMGFAHIASRLFGPDRLDEYERVS